MEDHLRLGLPTLPRVRITVDHSGRSERGRIQAMSGAEDSSTGSIYRPQHHVRIVTAGSLFDGHDAAINIMRRILQRSGAEVIHLGHNRSVAEIVDCAIQEDAQGIAVTSYQGGHVEFLKYMRDLLTEAGANIRIFAGGGGTILPAEIEELHAYGVDRIYSPDDGRALGLQGMINDVLEKCDFPTITPPLDGHLEGLSERNPKAIGQMISLAENYPDEAIALDKALARFASDRITPILGITGTGGSGKSSLVDELVRRFLFDFPDKTLAVISVDPSRRRSGGALLGDRIRMNAIHDPRVYMRSLATRQSNLALSRYVQKAIEICKAAGFDLIVVETSGIGQSDTEIVEHSDVSLYVMTAEYGAATQLEKIDMLDFADVIAINKFDKGGSLDALRDVRKQYRRNHEVFDGSDEDLPIFGTVASQFHDLGVNELYRRLVEVLVAKTQAPFSSSLQLPEAPERHLVIPPDRVRYLAEIVENSEQYDEFVRQQVDIARRMYQIKGTIAQLRSEVGTKTIEIVEPGADGVVEAIEHEAEEPEYLRDLIDHYDKLDSSLDPECKQQLRDWPATQERYQADRYRFQVRGRTLEQDLYSESLSHLRIPKVSLPRYRDWGDILQWLLTENTPGMFPFAGGVFPLKRQTEDPTRMFAGEGGPENTNRRFHYLSHNMPAKRLSTAFDSVTLYGEDPDHRPDIYGKVGNSGVSVATVDDAKKLYSGFNLADPTTSVSMTINGPAPMVLSFFMNAAIDQQCELYIRESGLEAEVEEKIEALYQKRGLPRPSYQGELPAGSDGLGLMLLGVSGDDVLPLETYERVKQETLSKVRGTVQADILKEDQAQNTCIFSSEFALRMMGDIQQYFIEQKVRNFYSVSISGYHIAEAGANPITQLAFTLANGFTLVEYYLSRGMDIDDFAPNLSFFFSNGMDPEYCRHRQGGKTHLGESREAQVRRQSALSEAQVPHPDLWPQSARPGDCLQRYPHHPAGPLRDLRQLQLPAHQCLRRGHHHPHRGERPSGRGDPADHQQGIGSGQE